MIYKKIWHFPDGFTAVHAGSIVRSWTQIVEFRLFTLQFLEQRLTILVVRNLHCAFFEARFNKRVDVRHTRQQSNNLNMSISIPPNVALTSGCIQQAAA